MEFVAPYQTTVLILGLTGCLLCLQFIILDIVAIKEKHIPGFAIKESHSSFLFRAYRAYANSTETVGVLLLFSVFAIFSQADPAWLNTSAIVYFAGRIAHMLFYYFDLKLLRSTAFVVGLLGMLSMFAAGIWQWI